MDLRETFNIDAGNYDSARPDYPRELYDDILRYAGLSDGASVLEIGIGTGQATLPFLERGDRVTAVELGDRLAEYCARKFAGYGNFRVLNGDFIEAALPDQRYDLIYSATAFHWIPKEAGYARVRSLLGPSGALALFWNHPYVRNEADESNRASMAVYQKYRPDDKVPGPFDESRCEAWTRELAAYGFADIESRLYHRVRTLTSGEYINLIRTYSDHNALPEPVRTAFEADMRRAIDAVGGTIHIYDTIDLYLARSATILR